MRRREGPSVALGAAALVSMAALLVAGRLVWNSLPQRTDAPVPRCSSPIAIIDRDGERLGCSTDVPCPAVAGDLVRLDGGCVVSPQAMRAHMRLRVGLTINVNTASADDLAHIDGVSKTLAQRIVAVREERRGFGSIEELSEVQGVGPATMNTLRRYLSVE